MTDSAGTASLEANLRLGNGLKEQDPERVLRRLAGLDARLRSFRADAVDLLLTVKERETPSQRTTLEATIANWPRVVATSVRAGLDEALAEVSGDWPGSSRTSRHDANPPTATITTRAPAADGPSARSLRARTRRGSRIQSSLSSPHLVVVVATCNVFAACSSGGGSSVRWVEPGARAPIRSPARP
jgi:hypothetical protein